VRLCLKKKKKGKEEKSPFAVPRVVTVIATTANCGVSMLCSPRPSAMVDVSSYHETKW
jgi:hypothetical protein